MPRRWIGFCEKRTRPESQTKTEKRTVKPTCYAWACLGHTKLGPLKSEPLTGLTGGFGLGCGDGLRAGPGGFLCSFGCGGLWGFFASDGGGEAELLAQSGVDFVANVDVFAQEKARAFAALAKTFAAKRNPRAILFKDAAGNAEVEQIAFPGNAFAVKDVEFGFAERRGDFVLYDFCACARADNAVAFFNSLNAANVEADRSIELQRAATGGGFGVAEHDADFFADLIDENEARLGFWNDACKFAKSLRHQACLQTHLR